MTPTETFAGWQAEMQAELDAARAVLSSKQNELAAACAVANETTAQHAAIVASVEKLPRPAAALLFRVEGRRREVLQIHAPVHAARAVIKEEMAKIADLEEALSQLARIMGDAAETRVKAPAMPATRLQIA